MFDMITTTWFPLSIHSLQGLPSPIKDPPFVSPNFPRKGWIAWGGVGREARTALITSDISNTDHRNAPLMPQNYHLFVIIDSILLLLSGAFTVSMTHAIYDIMCGYHMMIIWMGVRVWVASPSPSSLLTTRLRLLQRDRGSCQWQ